MRHFLIILPLALVLIGCNNNWSSSVPSAAVQINVDTRLYPILNPGNKCSYFYVDDLGHHYMNGDVFMPNSYNSGYYHGYAGVVVVNGLDGNYAAYDLCCPHCMNKLAPIYMDSYARAICPTCGEEYDTMNSYQSGSGFPTKGISREGLRRYPVRYYDFIIHVGGN